MKTHTDRFCIGIKDTQAQTDRFCVSCKFYSSYLGSAMCSRKLELDLVSGEEKPLFCIVERKYDTEDSCGMDGKFWERKE